LKYFFRISTMFAFLCFFLLASIPATACDLTELETEIVFTNSSLKTLQVSFSGDAQISQQTTEVPPLTTRTLTSVKRIKGTETNLTILLGTEDFQLDLTMQTSNTSLSFGAATDDLEIPVQTSSDIQRYATELSGKAYTLAFNGSGLNKGGRLTYVLHKNDIKPEPGGANIFNVLSYNVWATTIYGSKKVDTRLDEMPAVMAGYDALVLTEVFDLAPSKELLAKLRSEYPYQSGEIFKAGKLMESGTRILSRWPFETEGSHIYDACDGIQCAATRGVIYTRINKMGKTYHLFATHTQSSDDDVNRAARLAQLDEMGDYIRSLNIPGDEPVIMAGDFNVNKIDLPEDRDYMEITLNGFEPENTGHNYSFDSDTNSWAEKPYMEYLDYTLVGLGNQQPTEASQEIFAPRSLIDDLWGDWDLSDHYAAKGMFIFPYEDIQDPELPYFGYVVHLETANGHFVRAMSGGGSFISAGSDQIGTWESFRFVELDNGKVAILARDGNYVGLDSYLFGTLKANNRSVGAGEQFEIVDLGNNRIAIKADNGRYFRADFGGGAGLSAASWSIGNKQTFQLIRP